MPDLQNAAPFDDVDRKQNCVILHMLMEYHMVYCSTV